MNLKKVWNLVMKISDMKISEYIPFCFFWWSIVFIFACLIRVIIGP